MPQLLTGVNGGTFPNTCTGPSPGDLVTAASVNNAVQGVLNECKFLYDAKANLAGATFTGLVTCDGGLTIPTGDALTIKSGATGLVELGATLTINGVIDIVTDGMFAAVLQVDGATAQFINGARFYNWGKESYPDPQRLTDASQTISAHDGQIVILATPTAARTITVEQATDPPIEGQYIQFYLNEPGIVGTYYEIKREGSGNFIARIDGYDSGGPLQGMVRIHVEAGVWRLTGGVGLNGIGLDA